MSMSASEAVAVVATIDPDAYTAGDQSSDWVDAGDFHEYMAIVMAGTLGVSASITAKLEEATDSSGTGAQDISGATITALTGSGADSDKQAIINVRPSDLDLADSYTHFRLTVTLGDDGTSPTGTNSDFGAIVLGVNPRSAPASDNDLASVDSITTV